MKIIHVVGARPNFMKTAPLIRAMNKHADTFDQVLIHSGQHYDQNMSGIFFEHLGMPAPDVYLGVGSGSHAQQTAAVMRAFEPILEKQKPDWVVVVGDVNSTLACALTAAKMNVNVAHVEAGLRSNDRTMPEEVNRVLTDQVSDALFTPSVDADTNLRREGIDSNRIHLVGNVMIDSLVSMRSAADRRWTGLQQELGLTGLAPFTLVTLHRPANVDEPETLKELVHAIDRLTSLSPVVFPVHPRTRHRLESLELYENLASRKDLKIIEPLGYLDFLALESHAAVVITDSGGVQEETTYLGVPCLTVRPNTERPVTLSNGTNKLVSCDADAIVAAADDVLKSGGPAEYSMPDLWDGNAADRIVDVFLSRLIAGPSRSVNRQPVNQ